MTANLISVASLCLFLQVISSVLAIKLVGKVTKDFYWTISDPNAKQMTYSDAVKFCKQQGMELASIKNADEQSVLLSIAKGKKINANQGYNFWLSGNDFNKEGDWRWGDGSPIEYSQWSQSWGPQPRISTDYNCMLVSATYWARGGWFDVPCSEQLFPLCETRNTDYFGQGIIQLAIDAPELNWPGLCNHPARSRQSPVNLTPPDTTRPLLLPDSGLRFNGEYRKRHSNFFIRNDGHTIIIQLNREPTSNLVVHGIEGKSYVLAQIHFHWGLTDAVGSEHTLDGHHFPGEMHMVHYKTEYGTIHDAIASGADDSLAVLGVFLATPTSTSSKAYTSYRPIGRAIPFTNCTNTEFTQVQSPINIFSLLPIETGLTATNVIHQYNGSLTTSTCDEFVIWNVFNNIKYIDGGTMSALRKLKCEGKFVGDNFRSVQYPRQPVVRLKLSV